MYRPAQTYSTAANENFHVWAVAYEVTVYIFFLYFFR